MGATMAGAKQAPDTLGTGQGSTCCVSSAGLCTNKHGLPTDGECASVYCLCPVDPDIHVHIVTFTQFVRKKGALR